MSQLTQTLQQQFKYYNQEQLNNAFTEACQCGELDIIQYLLTSPDLIEHADIHTLDDCGFRLACLLGRLNVVKYLLRSPDLQEHADIQANQNSGLKWACQMGHVDIIDYLLTFQDLKKHTEVCDCFFKSCEQYHLDPGNQSYMSQVIVYFLSLNDELCIDFENTKYNLTWAMRHRNDAIVLSMIDNLYHNNMLLFHQKIHNVLDYFSEGSFNVYVEILEKYKIPANIVVMKEESLYF